jgi:hypothetical protein
MELHADGQVIKRGGWEIYTPNYDVVAGMPGIAPIRNEDDARLIAAAPTMLATLKDALLWFKDHNEPEMANALRAAIEKAEAQ